MRSIRGISRLVGALELAGCGGGSSSNQWKGVHSVTVTVARPGLPPPGGLPRTTAFTTSGEVSPVTAALNAHHIHKLSSASSNNGCAGGATIAITIRQSSPAPVHLSAYQCADTTSGDVGGDMSGFLRAVAISPFG